MSIVVEGELTPLNNRSYIPVPFEVPEGISRIHVSLEYLPEHTSGQPYPQQISLTVFDPTGPRSDNRPGKEGFTISEGRVTPGTVPGPIQAGQWTALIAVHRIMPPEPVHYRLEVTLSSDPVTEPPRLWQKGHVAPRGPGWYRGDLHAHSIHSDGRWDIPELVQFARDESWDFVTLSDHNTVSGLPQHHSLADDQLVTVGATELSTFYGHALALGVREWFEWRSPDGTTISMPELAQQVLSSGSPFVIAHPTAQGDPVCCGCHWEHEDMMPGLAPAVEVWNGGWNEENEAALQLFYRWLNEGHQLVATSGTDMHGPPKKSRGAVNVVYALEFSEQAILEGIQSGHSYISAGPELTLRARVESGKEGMMGDTLPHEAFTVEADWAEGHEGDLLRLIVDGEIHEEKQADVAGKATWVFEAAKANWCIVELRDAEHGLWAVTNPIFFE